jgi:hypothetical protein
MPPAPKVELRSATVGDAAFIVEMACHACVIEDWPLPDADSEDTQSLLPRIRGAQLERSQTKPGVTVVRAQGFRVLGQGRGTLGIAMRKELR